MTVTLQTSPYLREQRQFPYDDMRALANQSDQAYIDVASAVNVRTIGLYAINFPVITGESWYLAGSSQRQQSLRQVYQFTSATPIPHGINFAAVAQFTKGFGSYTNGANVATNNYFGVIYGSSVAIAGQVSFYLDPTNINILVGAGAPAIVSGTIVIEWLSQF